MDAVPLEKAPQGRGLRAAQRRAVGRRGHAGAPVRRDRVHQGLGRRGAGRRPGASYDWLHLHHEDFTGQYSKFYVNYAGAPWLADMIEQNTRMARGPGLRHRAGAEAGGGASTSRPSSRRAASSSRCAPRPRRSTLRWPAHDVDIAASYADGTPMASRRRRQDGLEPGAGLPGRAPRDEPDDRPAFRTSTGTRSTTRCAGSRWAPSAVQLQRQDRPGGDDAGAEPPPGDSRLLRPHHVASRRDRLKPDVTVLADEPGAPWVKYIHGDLGQGTWTYFGGHDPEDPQHQIGDPPTDLSLHPHSPGYRLILNNVLFPAAKKKRTEDLSADAARPPRPRARLAARNRRRAAGARSRSSPTSTPTARSRAARAVARGTVDCVLALPGRRARGARCCCTTTRAACSSRRAPISSSRRGCTTAASASASSTTRPRRLYVVVEVPQAARCGAARSVRRHRACSASDGPVARELGQYEDRQSQRDMAAYIADAYNDGGVAAARGRHRRRASRSPTWCRRWPGPAANGERTVVSTNTINLQEQLVGKDLPLLQRALGDEDWQPTLRAAQGMAQLPLPGAARAGAPDSSIAARARASRTSWRPSRPGRRAPPTAASPTSPVHADRARCGTRSRPSPISAPGCAARTSTRCFVFKARRRAAEADVVVVNHHLLASRPRRAAGLRTTGRRPRCCRRTSRLVLDEAHHLEDVAASHLGVQVTSRGVRRLLGPLRAERQGAAAGAAARAVARPTTC